LQLRAVCHQGRCQTGRHEGPDCGRQGPFPAKIARASLNLSTYIALYRYGYRNIYELGPLIEIKASALPFSK
jgi:hypothetical protein